MSGAARNGGFLNDKARQLAGFFLGRTEGAAYLNLACGTVLRSPPKPSM